MSLNRFLRSSSALLLLTLSPLAAFGQGGLIPSGPPAGTMKTLDQIESRIPISTAPFNITQSGSYYLTANLAVTSGNAVSISVENVTLDLNGYTISSTANPASGNAVHISGSVRNISVRNGHIRGGTTGSGASYVQVGFLGGVYAVNVPNNVRVSDISVSGVGQYGIDFTTDSSVVVERCTVETCAVRGIVANVVTNCTVRNTGLTAINGVVVQGCRGISSGSGNGITAEVASNSSGQAVSAAGLFASDTATNCTGVSTSGIGLQTDTALNCTGTSTSGTGLSAGQAQNCTAISSTGTQALLVNGTAQNCRAVRNGGVAINAGIAVACTVSGSGTVTAPQKFLGTP